jgi:hypothetical protein
LIVLCCHVEVSATGRSLVPRSPTEYGVCVRRGLHEATLDATRQRVQAPASERAASKMAMPVTCRNEKAVQSASSALVYHSTSQR